MNTSINKNLIFKSFGVLAVLALALVAMPMKVNASYSDSYSYESGATDGSYNYNYNQNGTYNYNNTNNTNSNTSNPMPILYSVSPNEVTEISGNMAVVLTGSNFIPGSMAEFNNSYRPTSYNNSGKLTVTLNASDVMTPGKYVISVFNPMPSGGTSNGVFFTVTTASVVAYVNPAPSPAPTQTVSKSTSTKTTAKTETPASATVDKSNLAANSLFAWHGFLPSTLFQWLLLAILILVLVLIIRKGFFEKDFHNEPMKHE
ncbi:MAG: hypothetical protein V4439_00835 [Patescibacteria group bacterium]